MPVDARMNIVVVGGHTVGRYALQRIAASGHQVAAVLTLAEAQRAKKAGYYSFYDEARHCGVPWLTIADVNAAGTLAAIAAYRPDLIFVLGWSQLLKEPLLAIPRHGTIGAHTSLLPLNRGRSPLNWALVNGDAQGGISMFYITPGTDTGRIIAQKAFAIETRDDIRTLYSKAELALGQMVETFLASDPLPQGTPQDNRRATYLPQRRFGDGRIFWSAPAPAIVNLVRALKDPYPGAFFYHRRAPVIVQEAVAENAAGSAPAGTVEAVTAEGVRVATAGGAVRLLRVQPQGQPEMWADQWAGENGIAPGHRLHRPDDFPDILEYTFLDGNGGTAYPTNIVTGRDQAVGVRLISHGSACQLHLSLSVGGQPQCRRSVRLTGDQRQLVTLPFRIDLAGDHQVTVKADGPGWQRKDMLDVVAVNA